MKIHFIGIGGIGVSALAKFYLAQGFEVSGSDVVESEITQGLEKLGAKIFVGHQTKNIGNLSSCDDGRLIYSVAVPDDNPELVEARRRGIKCQTYSQALGELTKKYFTIAVSGMHGKSTTTAMIGLILEAAGLDPTVIVGTKVKWKNQKSKIKKATPPLLPSAKAYQKSKTNTDVVASNFRLGRSKYLVIEADEYAASFLNYWPKIIVLTNIEEDHLDFYIGGLPQIIKTFAEYISHLGDDGILVANEEDKNIYKIIQNSKFKIQNYNSKCKIKGLNLKVPGAHNITNAIAALNVARLLKVPDEISVEALNNFTGTWRRMEFKGKVNGAKIYDDYGHHPTEIKATLVGARELLPQINLSTSDVGRFSADVGRSKIGRLWCIFQPHQYQRTYKLFNEFVKAFGDADKIILLPIYSVAGREKEEIKKKVSSEKLTEVIKVMNQESRITNQEVLYFEDFEKTAGYLKKNLKNGDICVIMGAGDIYKLTGKIIN